MKAPSEKDLVNEFRDLDSKGAKLIRALAKNVDDPDKLEKLVEKIPATREYVRSLYSDPYRSAMWRRTVVLHGMNTLIEGFGVEALGKRYEYINMGDPYTGTLIYDRDEDKVFIGAWGDIVESEEFQEEEEGDSDWMNNPTQSERSANAVLRQAVEVTQAQDGTWEIWNLVPGQRVGHGYDSRATALTHVPDRYRYYVRYPADRKFSHVVEYARLDNRMPVAHLDDENHWRWGAYRSNNPATRKLKNKLLK